MCEEAIIAQFKVAHWRGPIAVDVRSKAQICGSAGIAGSNPVESMNIRLLCLLCVV